MKSSLVRLSALASHGILRDFVGEDLRSIPVLLPIWHFLAVFVRACQEHDVEAVEALEAGQHVAGQ